MGKSKWNSKISSSDPQKRVKCKADEIKTEGSNIHQIKRQR